MRQLTLIVMLLVASRPAFAKSAEELVADGEALGKSGHYTEAIEAFKAADRVEPSAAHKCLIALAYTRRELWPQAEIFLSRCHVLATTEALPEWVPEADKLISERIAQANVAEVTFVLDPVGTSAELSVSSFAPDETFTPAQKIHLAPGHHVITANAPGFEQERVPIDIADKAPRALVIKLYRTGARPKPPSPLSRVLLLGGAATLGAGAIAYGVMGIGWLELRARDKDNFGGAYQKMYEYGRPTSLALFTVGAGLVIAGLVVRPSHPEAPIAAFAPLPGGGMVAIGWQR